MKHNVSEYNNMSHESQTIYDYAVIMKRKKRNYVCDICNLLRKKGIFKYFKGNIKSWQLHSCFLRSKVKYEYTEVFHG